MVSIPFRKMHGCRNDYVVVAEADVPAGSDLAALARAACDRRGGLGADGLLVVGHPDGVDLSMRMWNPDGSEAEMCGNGLRCVVKHLWERDPALRAKDAIVVDTGAGPLRCAVTVEGDQVRTVTVDMGRPRLTRAELPMTGPGDERVVEVPIDLAGDDRPRLVTAVSMGNPHAIVFVDSAAESRRLAETVGPALERHAWFPNKTNAEFAHVRSPREIDLWVWERGCGITLACGTGACATVVAACLTGRATAGDEVTVHLPGGDLAITVAPDLSRVLMRGPAAHVFDGDLDVAGTLAATRPVS